MRSRRQGVLRTVWLALVAGLVVVGFPTAARAQGKLSGVVFADYFYNVQGSGGVADSSAFRFRRIYLTYDNDIDTTFAVRFQLEADETELTSKGKIGVFVKQAFLRWKERGPVGDLFMGMSSTPLWGNSETVWGYRSIEKTILDLNKLGSATDIGVALQRAPAQGRPVGWHLMFANGNGQKPDNDRSKKAYLSIPMKTGNIIVEGVADYEGGPGDKDKYTLKLFGGWQKESAGFGVEGFRRTNLNSGTAGADVIPTGASVFGRARLTDRWAAFGRYDYFDPDAEVDNVGYREHLLIVGVDFAPIKTVHLMPNVTVKSYSGKASAAPDKDADVVARITLFYSYK